MSKHKLDKIPMRTAARLTQYMRILRQAQMKYMWQPLMARPSLRGEQRLRSYTRLARGRVT